jgi:hypothetical protein
MDSISAPTAEGTYQTVLGRQEKGLFLQRIDSERYCFRHAASGLSLFYFLGCDREARTLLEQLAERYNFERDSTWVLKSQGEIHRALQSLGLKRRWLNRAWHYVVDPESTAERPSTLEV